MSQAKDRNCCLVVLVNTWQARLWACGRGDVSTPSFGSHLNPISTRGGRSCPPYTGVHTKFWEPQARLHGHNVLKVNSEEYFYSYASPAISRYISWMSCDHVLLIWIYLSMLLPKDFQPIFRGNYRSLSRICSCLIRIEASRTLKKCTKASANGTEAIEKSYVLEFLNTSNFMNFFLFCRTTLLF